MFVLSEIPESLLDGVHGVVKLGENPLTLGEESAVIIVEGV